MTIVAIAAAGIGAVILAVELKSVKSEYGVYLVMAAGVFIFLYGLGKMQVILDTLELIRESWSLTAPIRMLAVTGTSLTEGEEGDQLTLFESQGTRERRLRQEKLEAAMDQVRGGYGRDALAPGRLLGGDLGLTRKKGGEGADGKEGEK